MKSTRKKLVRRVRRMCIADLGVGQQSCILVAGTARSGTTWIGDVVSHATRSRPIFEPFLQTENGKFALSQSNDSRLVQYQPYARAGEVHVDWQHAIARILQGRVRNHWCDRFSRPGVYFRRAVKAVRCNLLLDHIAQQFPQVKILYVVRNPLSVVNSQLAKMKQGWVMQWEPGFALQQEQLMTDWLEPYRQLIAGVSTDPQRQAVKWCIENMPPLQLLARHKNVLTVSYDDLVSAPISWKQVATFLGDRGWQRARFQQMKGYVSRTAQRSPEAIARGIEDLPELDARAEAEVEEVVHRFGMGTWLPHDLRDQTVAARAA